MNAIAITRVSSRPIVIQKVTKFLAVVARGRDGSSGAGKRIAPQVFDVTAGSTQTDFDITDNTPTGVIFVFVNVNTMPPNTYSFAAPTLTFNSAPGLDFPDSDFQIVVLYEYDA